jgi:hypothetical protein
MCSLNGRFGRVARESPTSARQDRYTTSVLWWCQHARRRVNAEPGQPLRRASQSVDDDRGGRSSPRSTRRRTGRRTVGRRTRRRGHISMCRRVVMMREEAWSPIWGVVWSTSMCRRRPRRHEGPAGRDKSKRAAWTRVFRPRYRYRLKRACRSLRPVSAPSIAQGNAALVARARSGEGDSTRRPAHWGND